MIGQKRWTDNPVMQVQILPGLPILSKHKKEGVINMIGEERQKLYEPLTEVVKFHKEQKYKWDQSDRKEAAAGDSQRPRRSLVKKFHDWLKKKICGCNAESRLCSGSTGTSADQGRREKTAVEPEGYVPPQMYL